MSINIYTMPNLTNNPNLVPTIAHAEYALATNNIHIAFVYCNNWSTLSNAILEVTNGDEMVLNAIIDGLGRASERAKDKIITHKMS